MDKFGIFNLLNSFFPLSGQKNQTSTINERASGFASSLISSLGNGLLQASKTHANTLQNTPKESPNKNVPLPLQHNMLLTINSHDEFVKRVKEKNKRLVP